MKHATTLVTRPDATMPLESADTSTKLPPRSLARAWVLALFNRFEGIFGIRWSEQFRTEQVLESAMQEWAIGLAGLSGEQIKRGLDKCRSDCKWPPTIAEFLDMALERGTWEHASPAYRVNRDLLALPKPRDVESAKAHLVAMKGLLHGNQ